MIKELSKILGEVGVNAFTVPASKDQESWNKYRKWIAKSLLEKGVKPTRPFKKRNNQ